MKKEDFHFAHPMRVNIRDVNYGGHVGNDVYLSYFQEGRIAYMKELGFSELNIGQGNGIILVKAEVEYKAELFHGDNIKVYVRISEVKNTSFIMEYLIEKEPDIVAAKGKTVLVSFNYEGRSITRVPDKFREKVETYQKK